MRIFPLCSSTPATTVVIAFVNVPLTVLPSAFFCRARPGPLLGQGDQAGGYRIAFDVCRYRVQLLFCPNPVVVVFPLPEWRARYSDDPVGSVCGCGFQPTHDFGKRFVRLYHDVHVIRHYYPRAEVVRMALVLAISQRLCKHVCDSASSQPPWTKLASVELSVEFGEGFSGIGIVSQQRGRRYWNRPGQTPGYEDRLAFRAAMWEISSPEHKNAGGKTASGTGNSGMVGWLVNLVLCPRN